MHVRPHPTTPTGVCRRELHEPLQALQRRLGQQRDRLYAERLHQFLYLVDVEERRHGEPPRRVLHVREPLREVLDQDPLHLDGQLLL